MKNIYKLLNGALLCMLATNQLAADIIPNGATIERDKNTFLKFEDKERHTIQSNDGDSIDFGKTIVLYAYNRGKTSVITLDTTDLEQCVSTAVYLLEYKDEDRIWIVSRLGRRLDGAILFNLKETRIEKSYVGKLFSLSPDKQSIAYAYPYKNQLDQGAVFVGNTMVYPKIIAGFLDTPTSGSQSLNMILRGPVVGSSRLSCTDYLENLNKERADLLSSKIKWVDNTALEFATTQSDYNKSGANNGGEGISVRDKTYKVYTVSRPANTQTFAERDPQINFTIRTSIDDINRDDVQ